MKQLLQRTPIPVTAYNLTAQQRVLLFLCFGIASFMLVIDSSIANISLPYIAADLGVATDEGTYVITWFAVGNAVGLAMTGWLVKKSGQTGLILASIALFTFFSWMCGISINLNMLIVSRFFQGLFGGPIIPLCQSMLVEYGTPESRKRDLSIWGLIIVTAPIFGPLAGGYITYWYSWPWIFFINIPLGLFCLFGIWFVLGHQSSKTQKTPNDILGIVLLLIGVSTLQIFLDKGQQWDWLNSSTIQILIPTFILCFFYLIIHEIWTPNPFLNLRLFIHPSFAFSIFCLSISFAIYFGTVVIVPLWLQEYMDYTPVWAGIAIASQGVGPVLLGIFSTRIFQKLGNLGSLALSFAFFGAGCFIEAGFTTAITVEIVSLARFIFGIGIILYIVPLLSISMEEIPIDQLPNATGIFHFFRSLFGGIGTAIFKTLFERRTIYHHAILGGDLTPNNPVVPKSMSLENLNILNNVVDKQSALLGVNDCFYFMGFCFVGLILLICLWYFWKRKHPSSVLHTEVPISGE